jgi:hypothetical protein
MDNNLLTTLYYASVGAKKEKEKKRKVRGPGCKDHFLHCLYSFFLALCLSSRRRLKEKPSPFLAHPLNSVSMNLSLKNRKGEWFFFNH